MLIALLRKLFITFLKIGGFTIGGGYVMLPLIGKEVVDKEGWVTEEEFIDLIALAQAAPGIMAVNASLVVGYKVAGFGGALMAALGASLPSFVIILVIAKFFWYLRNIGVIAAFMTGASAVVVALLIYAAYSLATKMDREIKSFYLGLAAFALSLFFNLSPIILIILGGVVGYLIYYQKQREGQAS